MNVAWTREPNTKSGSAWQIAAKDLNQACISERILRLNGDGTERVGRSIKIVAEKRTKRRKGGEDRSVGGRLNVCSGREKECFQTRQ